MVKFDESALRIPVEVTCKYEAKVVRIFDFRQCQTEEGINNPKISNYVPFGLFLKGESETNNTCLIDSFISIIITKGPIILLTSDI